MVTQGSSQKVPHLLFQTDGPLCTPMLTRGVGPVVDGADGGGPSAAEARLGVGLLAVAALPSHSDDATDVLLEQDVDQVRDEVVRLQSLQLRRKQSCANMQGKRLGKAILTQPIATFISAPDVHSGQGDRTKVGKRGKNLPKHTND